MQFLPTKWHLSFTCTQAHCTLWLEGFLFPLFFCVCVLLVFIVKGAVLVNYFWSHMLVLLVIFLLPYADLWKKLLLLPLLDQNWRRPFCRILPSVLFSCSLLTIQPLAYIPNGFHIPLWDWSFCFVFVGPFAVEFHNVQYHWLCLPFELTHFTSFLSLSDPFNIKDHRIPMIRLGFLLV